MAKAEYRSAIRSRQLIKAALADLLQEKPLDKITVTDIVNRAQINRGTFYAHYTDIPDVIQHLIQQAFSSIQEALAQPQQLADVPQVLLKQVQAFLEEDLDFYRKVLSSSVSALMQEQLVETVLEYLLQHEGDYPIGNHEQYVFLIRFCAGGLSNLYREWFAGKLPLPLDELTQRASALLSTIIAESMIDR